ncbi:hypothetical protein IP88_01980 [alpha proteobacterium AAP81b]|nr:hypothetical protein IP88_01980 [alpha proteobacterium AAP81b]
MLTAADEYPFHQTPDPIAFAGTDRNFYDRFFFNGFSADGRVFFALAFGLYPQLDIMDAAFSIVVDGRQHILRASRRMDGNRAALAVGPIRIEIVRPLESARITVAPNELGITADLVWHARHAPIEEPRFTRRIGTRAFMDYTRLTQNVGWTGQIGLGGQTLALTDGAFGTRDRSWGVRPVGKPDAQPPAAGNLAQFFWLWTPANFPGAVAFSHTNDDAHGRPWNRRAVVETLGGTRREFEAVDYGCDWKPGSRRLTGLEVRLRDDAGDAVLRYRPGVHFTMQGLGYTHPEWGHGLDHGGLRIAHDVIDLAAIDDNAPLYLHIQALSQVTLEIGGETHHGRGVVEQLFIGPHAPSGMGAGLSPIG